MFVYTDTWLSQERFSLEMYKADRHEPLFPMKAKANKIFQAAFKEHNVLTVNQTKS